MSRVTVRSVKNHGFQVPGWFHSEGPVWFFWSPRMFFPADGCSQVGKAVLSLNPSIPDTRNSLIFRLPNSGDGQAWEEFMAIHEPRVYRLARGKGSQGADARVVDREVIVSVSGALNRWTSDPEKGRFRDWLFRIAPGIASGKHLSNRTIPTRLRILAEQLEPIG